MEPEGKSLKPLDESVNFKIIRENSSQSVQKLTETVVAIIRNPIGSIKVFSMFMGMFSLSCLTMAQKSIKEKLDSKNRFSKFFYTSLNSSIQMCSRFCDLFLPGVLKSSLDQIRPIFDYVSETSFQNYLAVNELIYISSQRNVRQQNPKAADKDLIRFAQRIGDYAIKIYSASASPRIPYLRNRFAAIFMGIKAEDILKVSFKLEREFNTQNFILFKDSEAKEIVLAIRGTCLQDIDDVVTDLMGDEVPFADGFAHEGIANSAKKIIEKIHDKLKEAIHQNPGFKLVITGHSLGAGVANLITTTLLTGSVDFIDPNLVDIRCIALAPPPVFRTENLLTLAKTKNAIQIFVNQDDIVPSLSNGLILKQTLAAHSVLELGLTPEEEQAVIKGSDASTSLIKQIRNAIYASSRQAAIELLQHPGTVYHICYENDRAIFLEKSSSYFAANLPKLHPNNLKHHHGDSYQKALQQGKA